MAAVSEGYAFSRSSSFSAARSPDTASPIYPDRAIRPLPNRKLKSLLSPEQQNTIIYPASPPPIAPPIDLTPHESASLPASNGDTHSHHHHHHRGHQVAIPVHDHCTCKHDDVDSGDDEVEFDHPDHRYAPPATMTANGTAPLDSVQRRLVEASRAGKAVAGSGSVTSSADGYESFENTSNKKKRKIPLSGSSSVHQSTLSAEMAGMGISNDSTPEELHNAAQQQQHAAPSAPGTGISGAGRGRYGRPRDVRRPLASTNANSISGYGRRPSPRANDHGEGRHDLNTGGIISQAIKAAEQGPLTPQKGKENISLLHQSASSSVTPKTQFTFTCESDSASKMVDQSLDAAYRAGFGTPTPSGAPPRAVNGHPVPQGRSMHQGTQTAQPGRGGPPPRAAAPPTTQGQPNNAAQQPPPPAAKPKPRRRNPTKEYAMAARQRKLQQEYTNYHHRPNKDTMWICEFCEYEDIFGVPPHAMIRAYEVKDRAERKKAAEKRRLLEKAKMKNRKGKKGGKGKNNNSAAAPPPAPTGGANYDPNLPPPDGEDYYDEDEYGDEYEPIGPDDQYPADYYPPPPAPTPTPQMQRAGGGKELG